MDDISNSPLAAYPLEKHEFKAHSDEFHCSICKRPRALHQFDGFTPASDHFSITMDPRTRFGRHPHWFRPGTITLNRAEQAQIDSLYSRKPSRQMDGKLGPESATVAKPALRRIGSIVFEI